MNMEPTDYDNGYRPRPDIAVRNQLRSKYGYWPTKEEVKAECERQGIKMDYMPRRKSNVVARKRTKGKGAGMVEVTAEMVGVDPKEWATSYEAHQIVGGHKSTLDKRAQSGALETQTVLYGDRKIRLYRREQLHPVKQINYPGKVKTVVSEHNDTKPEKAADDLMPIKEIAQRTNTSINTIYAWAGSKKVISQKINVGPRQKALLVSLSSVEAKIKESGGVKPIVRRKPRKIDESTLHRVITQRPQRVIVPAINDKPAAPVTNLTSDLLRIADMIKDGMFIVTKMDIALQFNGNGENDNG